jgi:hypothetical protein
LFKLIYFAKFIIGHFLEPLPGASFPQFVLVTVGRGRGLSGLVPQLR